MTNYKLAHSLKDVKKYIGKAKTVAFDFETAPDEPYRFGELAALDPHRAHVVGCSFSVTEGTGIYLPLAHLDYTKNEDPALFWDFMKDLLTDTSITKVVHNLVFESSFCYAQGIVMQPPVYDTICASQLSLRSDTEFRSLSDSSLKRLAAELCGEPLPTYSEVTDGKHFDELNPQDDETVRYAAADSDYALRLMRVFEDWFEKYLPEHSFVCREIESPTAVYLGIMKYNGIPLDTALMQRKKEEAEEMMRLLEEEIHGIVGPIDLGSGCNTKELRDYFYNELHMPIFKTTASGGISFDDETLTLAYEWSERCRPGLVRLFRMIQEYRKYGKLVATYIKGYNRYRSEVTNCIHPDMFALSTETGRMSCSHPNAQNMPRKTNDPVGVRSFIKAPEGQVIVSCDYSQIELRIGADYVGDRAMLNVYQNNGDIHALTTSVLFNIPYSQALDKNAPDYKERRTVAKNVNFGTFYGIYPKGLQKTLHFKAGIVKSYEDCYNLLENLKAGYPDLVYWQNETKDETAQRLYAETKFGRRRYLPNIVSNDWGARSSAERCALNTPIQGTAADVIKLACGRILEGLPSRPWLKPILQIHDELCFLCPEDRVEEAVTFIKKCMEVKPWKGLAVPLIAEASVGRDFGSMQELDD